MSDKAMAVKVFVDAKQYEAMRKDAERYGTLLDHMDSLVLRTKKGSTLKMNTEQRGAQFTRTGLDAVLDGLRSA